MSATLLLLDVDYLSQVRSTDEAIAVCMFRQA